MFDGGRMNCTTQFVKVRDSLLRFRQDLAAAQREFGWRALEEFNWGRDCFDARGAIGADDDRMPLRVVDDAGGDEALAFADLRYCGEPDLG